MTHCQRVLELLKDGKPHSFNELYALHVIAHSRIADLRKQGHRIECWRDPEHGYLYRLLGEAPLAEGVSSSGAGTVDGSPGRLLREQPVTDLALEHADASTPLAPPVIPGQLTMEAA